MIGDRERGGIEAHRRAIVAGPPFERGARQQRGQVPRRAAQRFGKGRTLAIHIAPPLLDPGQQNARIRLARRRRHQPQQHRPRPVEVARAGEIKGGGQRIDSHDRS